MDFTRRSFLSVVATIGAACRIAPLSAALEHDPGDLAWHVLFLTNQQRGWRRVAPLGWSAELAGLAQAHSADMMARHFFDHSNPDGFGPAERLARGGLRLVVSENLYWIRGGPEDQAQLASIVVHGWMKNRGHRRNLLDPGFQMVGVGAAGDRRGLAITQLFGG